jgi:acyl carrier protein
MAESTKLRMDMNTLLSEIDSQAVYNILVEELGVEQVHLTPGARLKEDLGADSLTLVEITMALEERFSISIPDEEWERVSTVEELFEELASFLARQPGGPKSQEV